MDSLPHRQLTTLTLGVDFANITAIGATRAGHRGIAPVTGGTFVGKRLSGQVRPGHDWFVTTADGTLLIDVRLVLETDDGAVIYLAYAGSMTGSADAMARFRAGQQLAAGEYRLQITAKAECGDPRYAWLNNALIVGVGEQTLDGPIYHLFEVG